MKRIALAVACGIALGIIVIGQTTAPAPDHGFFNAAELKWVDGPPSLPPGAKVAMLEGNPMNEGPFTMRLQLPDGYSIAPHSHPSVEHLTIISGTFNLGMGEKFDKSGGQKLSAGSFGFMPPGMKHFAWTEGETVVQVHGVGPWKINYVNPGDDPRNKK
ncbi:MAG TPA: cupin domain-containing protein [Pyrinomonadaceae bacterium]|nr:cupin domain-containing protein [Pyrinomonadaceae bacterium]